MGSASELRYSGKIRPRRKSVLFSSDCSSCSVIWRTGSESYSTLLTFHLVVIIFVDIRSVLLNVSELSSRRNTIFRNIHFEEIKHLYLKADNKFIDI